MRYAVSYESESTTDPDMRATRTFTVGALDVEHAALKVAISLDRRGAFYVVALPEKTGFENRLSGDITKVEIALSAVPTSISAQLGLQNEEEGGRATRTPDVLGRRP